MDKSKGLYVKPGLGFRSRLRVRNVLPPYTPCPNKTHLVKYVKYNVNF